MKFLIKFLLMVMLLLTGCSSNKEIINDTPNEDKVSVTNNIKEEQIVSIKNIKKDLLTLQGNLFSYHPKLSDEKLKNDYKNKINKIIDNLNENYTTEDLYFDLSQILASLNDSHTCAYLTQDFNILPINFKWLEKGLYVTDYKNNDLIGLKVTKISGINIDDILNKISKYIPSENIYWTKYQAQEFIKHKSYLNRIGLLDNENTITFELEDEKGSIYTENIEFIYDESYRPQMQVEPKFEFKIDENNKYGLFKINKCINNNDYKTKLREFFDEVEENNIETIVIDLRDNIGGHYEVIDEFISYLNIEKYTSIKDNYLKKDIVEVIHKDRKLFDGTIYIAVSNGTSSTAVNFASIFKNNGFATIIGEPTGGSPTHYGYPKKFWLSNSKILCFVSRDKIISGNYKEFEPLYPDVYIPYTYENILYNTDSIEKWLNDNIHSLR